jgi:hypothetical protein
VITGDAGAGGDYDGGRRSRASACRLWTLSLSKTCCRWLSTVLTDSMSCSAIARFDCPAAAAGDLVFPLRQLGWLVEQAERRRAGTLAPAGERRRLCGPRPGRVLATGCAMRHGRLGGHLGREQHRPQGLEGGRHLLQPAGVRGGEGLGVGRVQRHDRPVDLGGESAEALHHLRRAAEADGVVQRHRVAVVDPIDSARSAACRASSTTVERLPPSGLDPPASRLHLELRQPGPPRPFGAGLAERGDRAVQVIGHGQGSTSWSWNRDASPEPGTWASRSCPHRTAVRTRPRARATVMSANAQNLVPHAHWLASDHR